MLSHHRGFAGALNIACETKEILAGKHSICSSKQDAHNVNMSCDCFCTNKTAELSKKATHTPQIAPPLHCDCAKHPPLESLQD